MEIVAALIRFFMDSKVNKNGATMIFSTHYSELLDEFDRIYHKKVERLHGIKWYNLIT